MCEGVVKGLVLFCPLRRCNRGNFIMQIYVSADEHGLRLLSHNGTHTHTHSLAHKYSHTCSLCLFCPCACVHVHTQSHTYMLRHLWKHAWLSVWHSHAHHVWDWRHSRGVCVCVSACVCGEAKRGFLRLQTNSGFTNYSLVCGCNPSNPLSLTHTHTHIYRWQLDTQQQPQYSDMQIWNAKSKSNSTNVKTK